MQIPAKLQLIGLKLIKAKTNLLHVHNHESRHIFLPGETHRNEITFPTEKINDIWYVKSPGTPREIRMLSSVGFHVKRKIFVKFLYLSSSKTWLDRGRVSIFWRTNIVLTLDYSLICNAEYMQFQNFVTY